MADPSALEQDAVNFATRAVQCDQGGLTDTATFYYTEAAQALLSAAQAGSRMPNVIEKANEYISRAEQLKLLKQSPSYIQPAVKPQSQLDTQRAKFLLEQAFGEDASNNTEEAFELYTQAAELFLKLRVGADKETHAKMSKLAAQAMDRAEEMKSKTASLGIPDLPEPPTDELSSAAAAPPAPPSSGKTPLPGPLGFSLRDEGPSGGQRPRSPLPPSGGGGGYTKEEIQVLRITSNINGRNYLPFMSVDMKERFGYPIPFSDKDGKLALSPKQQAKFNTWARPDEICDSPQMIYAISSFSIRQTVVSDCSFVASLAISAQYERRFKKKLITSIIFPQNRHGEPQFNPCGKYMVKLNINGVSRKVIIDDYLPVSRSGELLCSYSNNQNELWVSLLEKAYMKVMGGYDFPGSNSNIDLNALTGWIPERLAIRPGTDEFSADKEFSRIMDRFHKGHCLVTVATGEMSEAEGERAGLVPTHAYALLDIREVRGQKLMQLKNPWSHMRWKGNYSEKDISHWTPELKKALNFDPNSAGMFDNGVFWIDYQSVMQFFDVIYINWNPDLFAHTTCFHHTWTAKDGPKKDSYNIGDNPQYRLEVKNPGPHAVWILLSRHITDKDDFANNREFITVLVYKTTGRRIFYPYDPPPFKDGVRINSPHYLCKLVEDKGPNLYTLVISQYEKNVTTHYTLRVYATCEFSMKRISEPYIPKYEKQITGAWKGKTAGGCGNYPESYKNNPIYQINLDNKRTDNQVMIELKGPKQYSVGFTVVMVQEVVPNSPGSIQKKSSGDFRRGFCVLELENLPGGIYNIIPSTFRPQEEGPFFLNISSSAHLNIAQLQ